METSDLNMPSFHQDGLGLGLWLLLLHYSLSNWWKKLIQCPIQCSNVKEEKKNNPGSVSVYRSAPKGKWAYYGPRSQFCGDLSISFCEIKLTNQPTNHPSIHPSIHPTNQPIIQPKGHTSHSSLTYYQLLNRIIAQQIFIVASSKILIEILNDGPAAQCAKLFNAIPFFSHQVHYLVVDYFLFSTEIQYCIPV